MISSPYDSLLAPEDEEDVFGFTNFGSAFITNQIIQNHNSNDDTESTKTESHAKIPIITKPLPTIPWHDLLTPYIFDTIPSIPLFTTTLSFKSFTVHGKLGIYQSNLYFSHIVHNFMFPLKKYSMKILGRSIHLDLNTIVADFEIQDDDINAIKQIIREVTDEKKELDIKEAMRIRDEAIQKVNDVYNARIQEIHVEYEECLFSEHGTCSLCFDEEEGFVIMPCRHKIGGKCAEKIGIMCPWDRQLIQGLVPDKK